METGTEGGQEGTDPQGEGESAEEAGGSGDSCVLALCHPGFQKVWGEARLTDGLTDRDVTENFPLREGVPVPRCWPVSKPKTQLVLAVRLC